MKLVKSVDSEISHHKEKTCFFYFVSLWDDECSLDVL